jgi:hypothetical protein
LLQELKKQFLCAEEKGAGRLGSEYETALEKLISLKEEYLNRVSALRNEYEKSVEKGVAILREEYSRSIDKIRSLKAEYLNALDDANFLKKELIELFERYSLFNRLAIEVI